jgi:hypothetical protein
VRPVDIENETLKIGKPENWDEAAKGEHCGALSVQVCRGAGNMTMMLSKWQPEPEDLECLNNGGAVYLGVYGTKHPVVTVYSAQAEKTN